MVSPVGEYDPKALEERMLAYWRRRKVMEETLKPRKGKRFSFLEGPPTANAPPALHHVEVRAFKDIVNRFRYMLGYSVPRKAGWDCHGLPVEVQVERELKLKSKKDILEYGVDRFVDRCRESVFSHIREWDALTERMAYWVDLKDPYVTMDNDYIESVWWSLKRLWDLGLLYEGHKVVPLCPRCGTPLSSHEVAQGYQTVRDETVIVALRAKDRDYSFLAWTTTPWTLLSNVALAVHPKVTYALMKYRGEKYVLAKELAQKRFPEGEVVGEMAGESLVGTEYHPIFSHFAGKTDKPAWRVIAGDFVTCEEGTGIVHVAPAFGEDDYNVGEANGLALINPVGLDGKFTEEVPELAGLFVKDADPKVIAWLEDMGALVAKFPYEHEYPFCWRCKTPLLYYSMKSWFISVAKNVKELVKQNGKVSWYPDTIGSGRFGNWIEGAKDWSLSRNRFWGTPLPVWKCACGKTRAVGSRAELSKHAVGRVPKNLDLHRPHVDKIKLKCECGGCMERVEYVIDCWYDSGAATFAQHHYPFENKALFGKSFPYDFICEATDQTRGWFYTLLAISALVFRKPAYKSCVVGGLLLDDNGEKMSKSNKNIIDPWQLFNTVGADAVRLQMCSTAPWNARRFGTGSLNESVVPALRTLWNCYSFTVRYMLLDGYDPARGKARTKGLEAEDRWVIAAADGMVDAVRESLLANEYHHAYAAISRFIVEDLSRWYIKLVRDRLWLEDKDGGMDPSKRAAYATLSRVFERVCVAMAPLAPFIAEEMHLNLSGGRGSVHLLRWPAKARIDRGLIADMEVARAVFEAGSKCRQDAKIKLRYPVTKITVTGDAKVRKAVARLGCVMAKQLNAKAVEYMPTLPGVTYMAVPNYPVLGKRYGKDTGNVGEAIKACPDAAKAVVDSGEAAAIGGFEVTPEMVSEVKLIVPDRNAATAFTVSGTAGIVMVDTRRDESLMREALARELIRNVQELRKKADLPELKRIRVEATRNKELEEMLGQFRGTVLRETRADDIKLVDGLKTADSLEFDGNAVSYRILH